MSNWFYLSGPMSGYPEFNFPAFEEAAEELRETYRLQVRSAHEVIHDDGGKPGTLTWEEYIKADLDILLKCQNIILLQGWHKSQGARVELHTALSVGMGIYTYLSKHLYCIT